MMSERLANLEYACGGQFGAFGRRGAFEHLFGHGLACGGRLEHGRFGLACLGKFGRVDGTCLGVDRHGEIVVVNHNKRCLARFELHQIAFLQVGYSGRFHRVDGGRLFDGLYAQVFLGIPEKFSRLLHGFLGLNRKVDARQGQGVDEAVFVGLVGCELLHVLCSRSQCKCGRKGRYDESLFHIMFLYSEWGFTMLSMAMPAHAAMSEAEVPASPWAREAMRPASP